MLKGFRGIGGCDSVHPFVSQFYSSASTCLWDDESVVTHEIAQGEGGKHDNPLMPATIPRIPLEGLCNAVSDSAQTDHLQKYCWHVTSGATIDPNSHNEPASRAESKRGRKCSAVIPVGPGAAPLLEHLRFRRNRSVQQELSLRLVVQQVVWEWIPQSSRPPGLVPQRVQRGLVPWCHGSTLQSYAT